MVQTCAQVPLEVGAVRIGTADLDLLKGRLTAEEQQAAVDDICNRYKQLTHQHCCYVNVVVSITTKQRIKISYNFYMCASLNYSYELDR